MGSKLSNLWKYLNVSFIFLGAFLVLTMPASNEPSVTTYTYLFLTISLVVIGISMLLLPIILLTVDRQKRTVSQKLLWVLFIVIFNVMGSFISYFWLRENNT